MNKSDKVSIVIPMQQHSYQTAIGLSRANKLDRYYTTIYYNSKKFVYRFLEFVLPKDLLRRMHDRCVGEINQYVSTYAQLIALFSLFASRCKLLKKHEMLIRKVMFSLYASKVAKDIKKRGTKYVWSFDSWSLDFYKALEKQDVKVVKILDMASTAVPTIHRIIHEEYNKNKPFSNSYLRTMIMYSDEMCKTYEEEFRYADYFLSPSVWVDKSLLAAGVPSERIISLPHGVNVERFTPKDDNYNLGHTVRFLFVGRCEGAKGIYYLLEAFRQLQEYDIELLMVGDTFTWENDIVNYTNNVRTLGLKRNDEMPEVYKNADVFILSSLWEGSALSMMEAMASGMPVIASSHSCAPDMVVDGVEGFVYDPYSINELKECITWYVNNREKIISMGKAARRKTEQYTWEQYYKNCETVLNKIISLENEKSSRDFK